MRTFIVIFVGFLSALMLFLLASTLTDVTLSATLPSLAAAGVALLAGWAISAYFIGRNAATTSTALCRGFLLGAAEWLALIPVTRASPEDYRDVSNSVPAVLGEAIIRGLEVVMAAACVIAFAIAYFVGRKESPRIPASGATP